MEAVQRMWVLALSDIAVVLLLVLSLPAWPLLPAVYCTVVVPGVGVGLPGCEGLPFTRPCMGVDAVVNVSAEGSIFETGTRVSSSTSRAVQPFCQFIDRKLSFVAKK